MKKVIVTGASGFIGSALVKKLLKMGCTVYAVVRKPDIFDGFDSERLKPVVCDFSQYDGMAEKISDEIDCFFHFAWAGVAGNDSRKISVQAVNIRAAAAAIEQAKLLGVKEFLFAGSSYQYRMEPVLKNGEEFFVRKNLYGLAKGAARNLLWAYAYEHNMRFNSVLFTNVFGIGDRSARSANVFISNLVQGRPLELISGEHLHDWTYIDDAVNGILAVMEHGVEGVDYYIGHRELESFRNIVTCVKDTVSPKSKLYFGHYQDKSYIDYEKIDLERLYQDTGFECTENFEESIKKTAAWLSEGKNVIVS